MRIRQVKPSFWGDKKVAALPERTRLFYIGTWMLADDAGWFRWDAAEAGREMYGFDSAKGRERRVQAMLQELVDAGRVVLNECGHVFIPTLREHQRLAAPEKQVRTFEREHTRCVADARGKQREPAETRIGTSRDREGTSRGGGGGTGNETQPFDGRVPPFTEIVGGRVG